MKDIDFDELDRAVSSQISKNNYDVNSNINQQEEQEVVSPQQGSAGSSESIDTPEKAIPQNPSATDQMSVNPSPTISVSAKINRPNTGRFLDLVHPSANMRGSVGVPERNASSLTTNSVPSGDSRGSSLINSDKKTEEDDSDFDIARIGDELNKTLGIKSNESQETPFIQDAKVEKRPLNALISNDNAQDPDLTKSSDASKEVNTIDTPLPAELQSDILSIEANEVTKESANIIENSTEFKEDVQKNEQEIEPVAQEDKKDVLPESSNDSENNIKPAEVAPQTASQPISQSISQPIVVNSISQQYEEKPSTVEQKNSPIYDINNYHKTTSSVKKKSGWSWVVWITALMIISVGAGVAVYFFVLPQI